MRKCKKAIAFVLADNKQLRKDFTINQLLIRKMRAKMSRFIAPTPTGQRYRAAYNNSSLISTQPIEESRFEMD